MDHCYFYGLLCGILFWKPVAGMVRAFNKISTFTRALNFKNKQTNKKDFG